jgi:sRNA-binding carbon storage regulator CsrA
MLILARAVEERIVILDTRNGERIVIQVTKVLPSKVRLGFTAAPHYAIDREEIAAAKARSPRPRVPASPRLPVPASSGPRSPAPDPQSAIRDPQSYGGPP